MNGERHAGGLWCHEVLEHLSDYVDGVATVKTRARIEEHLRQCAQCSRFGDDVAAVVMAIRSRLREADPLPADLVRRLARAARES